MDMPPPLTKAMNPKKLLVREKYLVSPRYPISLRRWIIGMRCGLNTMIGNHLGVGRKIVSRWRCGERSPNPDQLERFALYFGVSVLEAKQAIRDAGIHYRESRILMVDALTTVAPPQEA